MSFRRHCIFWPALFFLGMLSACGPAIPPGTIDSLQISEHVTSITSIPLKAQETAVLVRITRTSPTPTYTPTEPLPTPIATPSITATRTPSPVPIITTTPINTPKSTATPLPWFSQESIGFSVLGAPLEVLRLGTGERWFVAIGAIHGGTECNTFGVVQGLAERIIDDPLLLPQDVSLFVLPVANPDGCTLNTRANANGIDLNRNWETDDWIADAGGPFGVITGSGGPAPFSEPETVALRNWLLALRNDLTHKGPVRLISHHSAVPPSGLTLPAYHDGDKPERLSNEMALVYTEVTGYPYSSEWVGNYDITGELIHWAFDNQIVAIDVELPDRNPAGSVPNGRSETHIETGLKGLLAILNEK